jgi:hypothetical protein
MQVVCLPFLPLASAVGGVSSFTLSGVCPSDVRGLVAVRPVFRAVVRAAFGLPLLENTVLLGLTLGLTLAAGVGAWILVAILVPVARLIGTPPSMLTHTAFIPPASQLSIS